MNRFDQKIESELSSVAPSSVRAYLAARGWQELQADAFTRPETGEIVSRPYSVWGVNSSSASGNPAEIVVPHHQDYKDYGELMRRLILSLEQTEMRAWTYIAHEIQLSGFDVVRVRIAQSGVSGYGVLSLDDANETLGRAREMMLAGACSTVQPKLYYAARKPSKANDYLKKVRLGQTESGSFIFTLLSPVAPALRDTSASMDVPDDPFERRVTRTLLSGISAIHDASESADISQRLEPFETAVDLGVSANLCDAIAGLSLGRTSERDVSISFSWSPIRPEPVSFSTIDFNARAAGLIREAGVELKAKAPREQFQVVGPVIVVKREPTQIEGEVIMRAIIDGGPRQVVMRADVSEFEVATRALNDRSFLAVVGTLLKDGRTFTMKDASDFRIIPDEAQLDENWH